jgi:2-desacetyl-2-hydroxyethyl bacteriochlorophyllide A dehydrogenase
VTRRETVGEAERSFKSRALWLEDMGQCEIRDTQIRCSGENAVVRMLFSGISRGTERLVFDGKVPAAEYARMRAPYQEGEFSYPVKYGYAAVGVVEEGPEALTGKRIFALHPHQDIFALDPEHAHLLPETIPVERAVLAANMETALNIVWDAGISPGERVAVFGAGVVGLLVAHLASRIAGTEVTICDVNPDRSSVATQLGLRFKAPGALSGEHDCLINASGSAGALRRALNIAGFESRIIEASWYGDEEAVLPLGGAFHARRLSIVSSQVGSLPERMRGRWDTKRRMRKALELLADDRLDCLITGETPFDDLKDRYADILGSPATLCHRITY